MAIIDKIQIGGELKDVADAQARNTIADNGLATALPDEWVSGYRTYTPSVGETFSDELSKASAWRYIKIACSPGDIFTVNAKGTTTFRTWAFADAELKCLTRSVAVDGEHVSVDAVITAPSDAAWLYINQDATRGNCYKGTYIKTQISNIEATHLGMKALLENGTDLNTVTVPGVYLLGANGNYGNPPSGINYGFLTIKKINAIICQTIETPSGNYSRFYNSSAWGNWAER